MYLKTQHVASYLIFAFKLSVADIQMNKEFDLRSCHSKSEERALHWHFKKEIVMLP